MCFQPPVYYMGCMSHGAWKLKQDLELNVRCSLDNCFIWSNRERKGRSGRSSQVGGEAGRGEEKSSLKYMYSIYSGYYSFQSCSWVDNMDFQGVHSPLCATSNVQCISNMAVELDLGQERVDEILSMVQPTEVSEKKRKAIIEYIQRLALRTYGIEVIPFGSVPLKTYLPEGDIDLAAMCPLDDEVMARLILDLLEHEYKSNTEFEVRDVTYIPAQVKVVKCFVKNIAVDISFNQTAGLSTLIFFQKVNSIIGHGHLFKRSVILIKAWCFYESRILGANHGLISTYALQTMIAHIINMFHSSLHSPIAVLYRFLMYYSTFNWEMHYVAINGLVLISTFPEVVVQRPEGCDDDLIITDDYLRSCREKFHPSRTSTNKEKVFRTKFLNVMDPLLEDNNLGKSIGQGNFKRIMAAFSYGYETLRDTLALPSENLNKGLDEFFHSVIYHNARSSTTIRVSLTDTEPCTDEGSHLSIIKEGDCSSSTNNTRSIYSPNSSSNPHMTMLINPAMLTMTSPKAKEAVVVMTEESQSSKDCGESSVVQNEPLSSSSKVTGGSVRKNQGAWNKPLIWSNEERKGAPKINPSYPTTQSPSSDMSKEVVASLESSVSNSSIAMPTKADDNQPSQSSVQNHQEVIEDKPAVLVDSKEFPCFSKSSGVQEDLLSLSLQVPKGTGWSEGRGQGSWNVSEQVEKGTEESFTLKINSDGPSKSSHKDEEAPTTSKSSLSSLVIPPTHKRVDENLQSQSHQKNDVVVEVKPALSVDMKEFPSFPIHAHSSVVQHKTLSLTSRSSKKVCGGSQVKGKGAWNKPLIWSQAEKDTEQEKVIDCGAWKVPLAPKLLAKVGGCSKDEPAGVRKSTTQSPAQKGTNRSNDKTAPRK